MVAAVRIVEDGAYRGTLLNELLELKAFLLQRRTQLGRSVQALHAGVPESVQQVTASQVATMLAGVDAVLDVLVGEAAKQLLLIKSSQRYLDRITRQLKAKQGQEAKFKRMAIETEHKRLDIQRGLVADAPKVQRLVAHTALLKAEAEKGLSAALGGRRVCIIGEINNIIK